MNHRKLSEKYRIGSRGGSLKAIVKDLVFGMFAYGLHQQVMHTAMRYKDVIHALLLGEFLGLPLLGTYYSLRILPYLIEDLPEVTARVLRDADVLELLHEGEAVH